MAATGSMGTPVGAFRWHMSTTVGAADWCPSAPLTAALRPRLASKNGASDKIRKNCAGVRKNAPTCALPMELGVCGVAYWATGTKMRDRVCLLVLGKVPRRMRPFVMFVHTVWTVYTVRRVLVQHVIVYNNERL